MGTATLVSPYKQTLIGRHRRRSDPLVPISGERLREVLKRADLTVAQLARRVKERQQTLDYIVRGKTKRCRKSRRSALARTLAISGAWLGGEVDSLRAGWDALETHYATRTALAWREFHHQVELASARDRLDNRHHDISLTFAWLISPTNWRLRLLRGWKAPTDTVAEQHRRDEDDRLGAALADTFLEILRPWFDEAVKLDLQALETIVGWQHPASLDPKRVPLKLRPLVPLAEEWGISDDVLRTAKVDGASAGELAALRAALTPHRRQIVAWVKSYSPDEISKTRGKDHMQVSVNPEAVAFMYLLEVLQETSTTPKRSAPVGAPAVRRPRPKSTRARGTAIG